MKKITLLLCLLSAIVTTQAQVTYFNYLDYTSEWRNFSGGWNGVAGFSNYTTTYFDGDAVVNGQTYYQFYESVREVTSDFFGNPVIEENVYGPGHMREDPNGKFYALVYGTTQEIMIFDNLPVLAAQPGEEFPLYDNCTVATTETLFLGDRPLKLLRGNAGFDSSAMLEGVGRVGLPCGSAIETAGYLACYTKNGNTISFENADCDDFPVPFRTHLRTTAFSADAVAISPNPAKDQVFVRLSSADANHHYTINDLRGATVVSGTFSGSETQIDVSGLASGMYGLQVDSGVSKKIVKQ